MPNLIGKMKPDATLHGVVSNATPDLIGKIKSDGTLRGIISSAIPTIKGQLSNATLRGMPVEIRIDGTLLQWKYEDETTWRDLIDLATIDYSTLSNLPTINGVQFIGEMRNHIITPSDEITIEELENILDIT